ncbi:MAG: DUF2235 domain-containing protein [Xanthobacteraceae bacterium]|nr:DUF2235 domain-containing protein [Xanthobacteraceae bacterium]
MSDEPAISAPKSKKLAIFLDGTWNAVDDNTNVWRMKALCATSSSEGAPQLVYYDIGVNGFVGGTVGKGLSQNVREAYEWLIDNYNIGDDIFIFGFSRGAYTARSLAGLIAKHGLLKPGSPLGVAQIFARYQRPDDRTLWKLGELQAQGALTNVTLEEQWMMKYSQPVKIKMVGVWDTVGSLGIPFFSIAGISRSTFGWLHTGLRLSIENGYHALAIDEHRRDFAPTLWSVRWPNDPKAVFAAPRPLASVEQRWFAGAHANVGGGYASDLLAQVPLRWLMKNASRHGLVFRNDVELDGDVLTAAMADSYKAFMGGIYSKVSRRYYRAIGAAPEAREGGTHTNVNETIDGSVFERWRSRSDYRPPNLADWAKRKTVDPTKLKGSVRADNPSAAAPD